ncbi:MAG: sigma-70 family RNA polymerase sigma factor [Oscillospiraceae bacterium]|nr:sigma-70 family RNA polymerase sigma factor [Oscillospiraceae bacterium]
MTNACQNRYNKDRPRKEPQEAPAPSRRTSDEELCALARQGSREAEEVLITRYHRLVRRLARPLYLAGGEQEDLIQEGMIGLVQGVREYDGEKSASFHTYAEICIRSRLLSAVRAAARHKHSPLNQSVSLELPFFENPSSLSGEYHLVQANPEDLVIGRERVQDTLRGVRGQLSEFEAKILGYYLDGLTIREMAEAVSRSPKSVDNAVQRIRRKVARHLSSGDLSGS